MENVIVVLILLAIAGGIIWYLLRAQKREKSAWAVPTLRIARINAISIWKPKNSKKLLTS